MTESAEAEAFQQRLWDMFHMGGFGHLSLPQIDRIRWHLFPEIRLPAKQIGLFDEVEARGSAGSAAGDGLAAGAAGAQPGRRPPGHPRRGRLRQDPDPGLPRRAPGPGVRQAHPGAVLQQGPGPAPGTLDARARASPTRCTSPASMPGATASSPSTTWACPPAMPTTQVLGGHGATGHRGRGPAGLIPAGQYDAVLIDEGHDFRPEWLKLVVRMVDPAHRFPAGALRRRPVHLRHGPAARLQLPRAWASAPRAAPPSSR
jgi:hypothetical protein